MTDIVTRPILFSGPMVRAILDGRKTQTRRIVKPQFGKTWGYGVRHNDTAFSVHVDIAEADGSWKWIRCPFGKAGDRLWVRETWRPVLIGIREGSFDYRADDPGASGEGFIPWKPSIHMPRKASRITLEITKVRVERLTEISNEDCTAEGITAIGKGVRMPNGSYAQAGRYEGKASTVRQLYSELWVSINGQGSWAANPWVWVVEFEVVK